MAEQTNTIDMEAEVAAVEAAAEVTATEAAVQGENAGDGAVEIETPEEDGGLDARVLAALRVAAPEFDGFYEKLPPEAVQACLNRLSAQGDGKDGDGEPAGSATADSESAAPTIETMPEPDKAVERKLLVEKLPDLTEEGIDALMDYMDRLSHYRVAKVASVFLQGYDHLNAKLLPMDFREAAMAVPSATEVDVKAAMMRMKNVKNRTRAQIISAIKVAAFDRTSAEPTRKPDEQARRKAAALAAQRASGVPRRAGEPQYTIPVTEADVAAMYRRQAARQKK